MTARASLVEERIAELGKACRCLYIAVDATVADDIKRIADAVIAELRAALAARDEARAALQKYGRHDGDNSAQRGDCVGPWTDYTETPPKKHPCSCGLDKALASSGKDADAEPSVGR